MAISGIWCIRPSRDVTCGCTYEAVDACSVLAVAMSRSVERPNLLGGEEW